MDPALEQCSLYFSHQDQVTALPAGAELLGGNVFCPNALFSIEANVLGIQGHPELTRSSMVKIIERRKDSMGAEAYNKALDSLNQGEPDAGIVGKWIIEFIQSSWA
jgi:GMP synthase (glutamine-hydrolysing)